MTKVAVSYSFFILYNIKWTSCSDTSLKFGENILPKFEHVYHRKKSVLYMNEKKNCKQQLRFTLDCGTSNWNVLDFFSKKQQKMINVGVAYSGL